MVAALPACHNGGARGAKVLPQVSCRRGQVWLLSFSKLGEGVVNMKKTCDQREDAKAALVRLAGGASSNSVKEAVLLEFGQLRVNPLPIQLADVCQALNKRKHVDDGRVVLASAASRRNFWLVHMAAEFPHLSEAASRLLSAHVTSCATERNWSLFGNIFTKTRNRLALARAQDIAFVRANNSLGGRGSADEEVMLSITDLIEEEGGEGEEDNMVE